MPVVGRKQTATFRMFSELIAHRHMQQRQQSDYHNWQE